MNPKKLIILMIIAAVGGIALATLFARNDLSAKWGQSFDRQQAIAIAQSVAARQGIDVTGWRTRLQAQPQRETEEYFTRHPESQSDPLLSPLATQVEFESPTGDRKVRVDLMSNGRWFAFLRREGETAASAEQSAPTPSPARTTTATPASPSSQVNNTTTDSQNDRALAEKAIAALLGAERARFQFQSENYSERDGRRFVWATEKRDLLKYTAEVAVRKSQLREVRVGANYDEAYLEELRNRPRTLAILATAATLTLVSLVVVAALVLFFLGISRREIDWRLTLSFAAIAFILIFSSLYYGGLYDDLQIQTDSGVSAMLALVIKWLAFILIGMAYTLIAVVIWGPGYSLSLGLNQTSHIPLAALLRGRILSQKVAWSIAAGLLLAPLFASIRYLIASSHLFGGTLFISTGAQSTLASVSPVVAAFTTGFGINYTIAFDLLITFGFIAPALKTSLSNSTLARVLTFIAGLLIIPDMSLFRTSASATLVTALVIMILFDQLYRHFDLLTLIIMGTMATALLRAMALINQPIPSLQRSGSLIIGLLATATVAALVISWKGKDLPIEADEMAARHALPSRAERDRLRAEFGVARKAQQQMLPAEPPPLDGFSISALCTPAREVGGDLYEFIQLPEGRLGIVVADVSGKGVPAALYMTLTKGLLLSVSEDCTDPGEILCEVNKHLYEVCRRKMFVTLFLGVIDPASRTLAYARAGHNPPVWRQPSNNKTTLLRAPGIGLGLNSGKSFDRILAVEKVSLTTNDVLILYSDGITEAMNAKGEEYGELRLMSVAAKADGLSAGETRDLVLFDVNAFLGKVPPQDDQTLVVVKVNG